MSCFIVSDKHISSILKFADRPQYGAPARIWTNEREYQIWQTVVINKVGQILVNQNYASYAALYEGESVTPHEFTYNEQVTRLTPVEIIKLCNAYEYQSDNTPDYSNTPAHKIIKAILDRAINELPGYDAAEWAI